MAGEVLGTGLAGALLAYPVATLLMGREVAVLFFVVPLPLTSLTGAAVAYLVLRVLRAGGAAR